MGFFNRIKKINRKVQKYRERSQDRAIMQAKRNEAVYRARAGAAKQKAAYAQASNQGRQDIGALFWGAGGGPGGGTSQHRTMQRRRPMNPRRAQVVYVQEAPRRQVRRRRAPPRDPYGGMF